MVAGSLLQTKYITGNTETGAWQQLVGYSEPLATPNLVEVNIYVFCDSGASVLVDVDNAYLGIANDF